MTVSFEAIWLRTKKFMRTLLGGGGEGGGEGVALSKALDFDGITLFMIVVHALFLSDAESSLLGC